MMSLTGRKRLRVQSRFLREPVLVLEVEWSGTIPQNLYGCVEMVDTTFWRDARIQDISAVEGDQWQRVSPVG